MKPTESQIEDTLRHAPRPQAPSGLKQTLADQIKLPAAENSRASVVSLQPKSWWQRWWPALAPATASLACAVVITIQHNEIASLKESIRSLKTEAEAREGGQVQVVVAPEIARAAVDAASEADEIARLKQRVATLTSEIAGLEAAQKTSESLRTQSSAQPTISRDDLDALNAAREKALYIQCVNNMKQVCLGIRIWANDNHDVNPPDFLSMSNELVNPKILFCPADKNHPPVKTWAELSTATSSYDYLAVSVTNADAEPYRIAIRCPIHGNAGMTDGSVQGYVLKKHPEQIVERDGKLYLDFNAKPANQ